MLKNVIMTQFYPDFLHKQAIYVGINREVKRN